MQKRLLFFFLSLSISLYHCDLFSQKLASHFKNYTVRDGLPANKTNCVLHSKDGFIWIGTDNGLVKFDGLHFTYFNHDIRNKNSIASDVITSLYEDLNGNIWIGTYEGGLDKYIYKTKSFIHLTKQNKQNQLPDNRIINIFEHPFKDDFVLVSLHFKGLAEININTNKITTWQINLEKGYEKLFGQDIINDVKKVVNQNDKLWISTNRGLFKYDVQTKTAKPYYFQNVIPIKPETTINNIFREIILEGDSIIWLASWAGGIIKFEPKTIKWSQFLYDTSKPISGGKNIVKNIIKKDNNEFWVATEDKGFGVFNKTKATFSFYSHQYQIENSIPEGLRCLNIYQDFNNGIWVMMNSGLSYLHPNHQISKRIYIPDLKLTTAKNLTGFKCAIPIQSGNKILVGFEEGDGIYVFNKDYKLEGILNLPNQGNKSVSIYDLVKGANGEIYCYKGSTEVYAINEKTLAITKIPINIPYEDFQIYSINYIQNKLYLGLDKYGIAVFDGNKTQILNQKDGLVSDLRVYKILNDNNNHIWFATDRGFSIYNPETKKFKNYNENQNSSFKVIANIQIDNKGLVWVISLTGDIYIFSPKEKYKIKKVLISGQDFPKQLNYRVRFDGSNNAWISNRNGFLRYNFDEKKIDIINTSNGLQTDISTAVFSLINQTQLLIPGRDYFDVLNTIKFKRTNVAKPRITGVFLLDKAISEKKLDSLTYLENNISIQLSNFNFENPESIKYYYRFENQDWIEAKNGTINFANLKPDDYKIEFRAISNLNQASSSINKFSVKIKPPFWLSWWFYVLIMLGVIFILYLVYNWRMKQIYRENKLKVAYEKETANLKMTALRTQMNPHFLFNSLSAMKLLIMKEENVAAAQYLTKFSHLLRSILEYSQEETITLKKELEISLNYIEVENLRLNEKMEFKLEVDENINLEQIKIPPLLLQPYLENAIWHGLMPLQVKGLLFVNIDIKDQELIIKITDNGVGREKSAKQAQLNPIKNKSYGIAITRKRMELYSDTYQLLTEETLDLLDNQQQIIGTQVIIKLKV